MNVTERDVVLPDGRNLHIYDTVHGRHPVVWHHGTPNIGSPPVPLFEAAERLGIRWISYDRPGYGGSTAVPDRDVASAAADVRAVTEALGVDRFGTLGHSGGGSHALACAALLPDRVWAAVPVSGLAPFGAAGLDWYAGMSEQGRAALGAAVAGRAAKEAFEATNTAEDPGFIPADWAAFAGPWGWFGEVVRPALKNGPGPLITDDLAHARPWGFDVATVGAPVLVVHGGADRVVPASHGRWVAGRCPGAELWIRPDDGHISVLAAAPDALAWLVERAG